MDTDILFLDREVLSNIYPIDPIDTGFMRCIDRTIDKYGHQDVSSMGSLGRYAICISITLTILLGPFLSALPGNREGEMNRTSTTPRDDPELPPWGYYKGILPNALPGEDLESTYRNASSYTQFVPVWGRPSPFYNLSTDLEGPWGQIFVDRFIRGNGMFPLVHMNFYGKNMSLIEPPDLHGSTLNSSSWRSVYLQSVKDVVNASRPRYLSLGNEVNRWFERYGCNDSDDNSLRHFVSLYNKAYDEVKEISPDTLVFCTFAREIVSFNREANLSVIDMFDPDRMDLLVMTSYPFSVAGINRVSDIPDNYYSRAFDHITSRPFGFSEVAWTSNGAFGGENEQAAFVENLTSRLTIDRGVNLELMGWSWLHDLGPGDSTGLVDLSGREKMVFNTWKNNMEPEFHRENRTIDLPEDFGSYTYPLNRTFFDPDPWDTLSFSVWNGTDFSNCTENMVRAEVEGGNLTLYSIDNRSGLDQLRIRATDWSGESNWTIMQVVLHNVDDPPGIMHPMDTLSFSEGGSPFFDLSYYIYDVDDPFNTLSISILDAPGLNVSANLSISPYMVLFAEEENFNGDTYILMMVVDPHGEGATFNLTVRILPVNDPPVIISPGEIIFEEDTSKMYNLSNWVEDPDSSSLTWNIISSDPLNLSISLLNETLLLTPARDWFGHAVLALNVSDGEDTCTYSLPVTISPVNDPPRIREPEPLNITEDEEILYNLSLLDPLDPDGDTLYWYLENSTSLIRSVSFLDNGSIRIRPVPDGSGSGGFYLRVQDGRGGVAYARFSIEVEAENDPPVFFAPENWTLEIPAGGYRSVDLRSLPYFVEDVDDPIETLTVVTDYPLAEVNGLIINISVPGDTASGNITIMVEVGDPHGASTRRDLRIIVMEEGDNNGNIRVDNITFSNRNGIIRVTAHGEKGQNIWVVFTGINGLKGSFLMKEEPEESGSYTLEVSDPGWEDGEQLYLYLSRTKGGPNESGELPIAFTYEKGNNVQEKNMLPYYIGFGLIGILFTILVTMLYIRKKREHVSDFDYGSLLEE